VASRVPRGKIESIVGCDAQKLNAQGQTIDNRTTDKSKLKQIEGNKIKSRKRRQAGKKKSSMYVTPFGLFIMMIIERSQRGVYAIAGIKLVLLGDFCFFFFGYSYVGR